MFYFQVRFLETIEGSTAILLSVASVLTRGHVGHWDWHSQQSRGHAPLGVVSHTHTHTHTEWWKTPTMDVFHKHRHTHNVTSREWRHGRRRGARGEKLGAGQRQGQALAVGRLRVSALGLLPITRAYSLFYLNPVVCGEKNTAQVSHL